MLLKRIRQFSQNSDVFWEMISTAKNKPSTYVLNDWMIEGFMDYV